MKEEHQSNYGERDQENRCREKGGGEHTSNLPKTATRRRKKKASVPLSGPGEKKAQISLH